MKISSLLSLAGLLIAFVIFAGYIMAFLWESNANIVVKCVVSAVLYGQALAAGIVAYLAIKHWVGDWMHGTPDNF